MATFPIKKTCRTTVPFAPNAATKHFRNVVKKTVNGYNFNSIYPTTRQQTVPTSCNNGMEEVL